jgi:hypothetical protein
MKRHIFSFAIAVVIATVFSLGCKGRKAPDTADSSTVTAPDLSRTPSDTDTVTSRDTVRHVANPSPTMPSPNPPNPEPEVTSTKPTVGAPKGDNPNGAANPNPTTPSPNPPNPEHKKKSVN